MSKRPLAGETSEVAAGSSDAASSGDGPAAKKRIVFEPLQLGPIANLEELELKTLAFQNQKLSHRLNQRIQVEEELRVRIDQLEKRQTQDDAVINVINRCVSVKRGRFRGLMIIDAFDIFLILRRKGADDNHLSSGRL